MNRSDRMDAGLAREFQGIFVPDNRSESGIHGSTLFTPEIAEEEERVVRNDRLRTRRIGKTFKSKKSSEPAICEKMGLGGPESSFFGEQGEEPLWRDEWMLNESFVPLEEIVDPRTDFQIQTEVGEE